MKARKACLPDAPGIHGMIAHYAAEDLLLPRDECEIRDHIGRFLILEEKAQLVGCVALEPYSSSLAEIRSLAVLPEFRGCGLGGRLIQFALAEARRRRIARVFAVTQAPDFFLRQGFQGSSRAAIPEKMTRDCCTCSKLPNCRLAFVFADLLPERLALRVLSEPALSTPLA